jgi:hypothetical protein
MLKIIDRHAYGFVPFPLIRALRQGMIPDFLPKYLLKMIGELIRYPAKTVYDHVFIGALERIIDFSAEKDGGCRNEGECQ